MLDQIEMHQVRWNSVHRTQISTRITART